MRILAALRPFDLLYSLLRCQVLSLKLPFPLQSFLLLLEHFAHPSITRLLFAQFSHFFFDLLLFLLLLLFQVLFLLGFTLASPSISLVLPKPLLFSLLEILGHIYRVKIGIACRSRKETHVTFSIKIVAYVGFKFGLGEQV